MRSDGGKSGLQILRRIVVEHRTDVNRMIVRGKQKYYEEKLSSQDQKACFKVIDELVNPPSSSLSSSDNPRPLCRQFATFFSQKFKTIKDNSIIQSQKGAKGLAQICYFYAQLSMCFLQPTMPYTHAVNWSNSLVQYIADYLTTQRSLCSNFKAIG